MKKAIVVFSGGQDSTTCLVQAIDKYGNENVETVSFSYGQKHCIELEAVKKISKDFNISNTLLDANFLSQLTKSDLFVSGGSIEQGEKYPSSFVEGRNMVFLLLAAIYAKGKDTKDIIIGVSQTDFSGYPDCRDIFIKSLNVTLNLAMDYDFNLITPLMWLDKKETWALADKLGYLDYIKENTHSCYNNVLGGCNECPACILRNKGYQEYINEKR